MQSAVVWLPSRLVCCLWTLNRDLLAGFTAAASLVLRHVHVTQPCPRVAVLKSPVPGTDLIVKHCHGWCVKPRRKKVTHTVSGKNHPAIRETRWRRSRTTEQVRLIPQS